ncbi:MAG: HPr family phosphocarrier protein [Oscillospiraceae bacterium]|nr:HPr family phosphocarrier protein [Oscillospiraceae bacterium]
MKEFNYTITDPDGVHARPAGILVSEAEKYKSSITLEKDGKKGDAKRIFSVMGLGIKCGQTVNVKVEGADEENAAVEIEEFLKENCL